MPYSNGSLRNPQTSPKAKKKVVSLPEIGRVKIFITLPPA